jgi:HK97 family phage portal protein
MMATLLYGPDGQKLISSGDFDQEKAYAEIQKRVRAQSTTLTQVWDPKRGKPKPTPVTFDTLRMMANRNEWVAAIRKTRKNQIGRIEWSIVPKDEDDDSPSTERMCEQMTELFKRPSLHGSRPNSRSWRQFIGEVLDDILTLDAGCIEKERNGRGWIVAMYPVDGGTIRPNIDARGGFADHAYVQLVDGQVTANFGLEDLIYIMDNPQTDVRYAGYGFSPLEHLIVSVTAELFASRYNADYFQKGSVPEGLLNLGEEVAPEDVDAFRLYWMNEIMGKPWAIPIVGGKGVQWVPWRQSNKDMEYSAYQQWLLKKMCAVYQIPPQEVGELEDVNRSTAQDQDKVNQSKSIEPLLTLLADFFETEIIGVHGQGLGDYIQFKWELEEEDEQQVLQKFQVLVDSGAATRNEMREALSMDPVDDEGADLLLVGGQLQGLPTEEDIQVQGAAAQQKQQQQQAQMQMEMQGATPGTMPWKPGDPNDPKLQAAQAQHRQNTIPTGPVENADKSYSDSNSDLFKSDSDRKRELEDRNPALTEHSDAFEDEFTHASDELYTKLADILQLPSLGEVDGAST